MTSLKFGQPANGIIQFAYTVANLDQSIADYGARLHVGPWFVIGPFTPPEARYRGQPTSLNVTIAMGFSGHIQVELIQQNNDVPSVFRELIDKRGHGFHHWGVACKDFDREVERHRALGYEVAFSDRTPDGTRIAYMDATAHLPGMVELIEMTDATEAMFTGIYQASLEWGGSNPVRKMGL
jgi:hypothetical protein